MNKLLLPTPYGTRDILFPEAYNKRVIENTIADIFTKWGYQEVVTPTYEYMQTFELGSRNIDDKCIKFFNRENKTLVLRQDMTTPIARLIATGLYSAAQTHKLFYIANVFRHEQTQSGRQCEFYQAGVEYFGASTPLADAEVIALAIEAIRSTGLTDFKINLGHVDFINGILSVLPAETRSLIQKLLSSKDVVGLKNLLDSLELSANIYDILHNIFFFKGDERMLTDLRSKIDNPLSLAALENLLAIYELLSAYDLQRYIVFDLALTRDMDYYSGMVFEGYTGELGYPICGGGRYDSLLSSYGLQCPATGFALGIERLMLLLNKQGLLRKPAYRKALVVWGKEGLLRAIARATAMQLKGYITTVADHEFSTEELALAKADRNYDEVIMVQ